MSLTISEESVIYAPRFEAFAREISDREADELESDPIARSASLRQTADLIEPDWLMISGIKQILADLPDRDGRSLSEYEFVEVGDGEITDLAEVVRIISEVRAEPVVCIFPDPVAMVAEVFGEEWTELLSKQTFDFLDTLHVASQFLTDVLREFRGNVSGIIVDGTYLPEALDGELSLDEYILELGALFNLADHYDISIIMNIPSTLHTLCEQLADEFDVVTFESVEESTVPKLPATSEVVGCSFTEDIWETDDTGQFSRQMERYLTDLPSNVQLLTQEIPGSVRPEHVQAFGNLLDAEF
jgi:hypothetical protein